ncbi:MAG TPA: YibE/F family protein [Candidatus Paceibacterota bacterium]|nr:YibE/F family protein [Candidatus Paceibacterota bacterium]
MQRALLASVFTLLLVPFGAGAQEESFSDTTFKAIVESVESSGSRVVEGTDITETYQLITVRILEGVREGEQVSFENATPTQLEVGDRFYLHRVSDMFGGPDTWSVWDPDRSGVLLTLLGLFVVVAVLVAGMAGVRSLVALALSFALIIFGLVPALSSGFPPVITSVGFGVVILALSMFVTHGVNRPTVIALLGSFAALVVAAVLAQVSVMAAKLSGLATDEAAYLNFATAGTFDLIGLLLGGILVGIIGVLNDVSVSQVHTVAELHDANPELSRASVWKKSMKVGREHMGAVVNTLPLAYAGVSLPLLLLFSESTAPFSFIVNREVFAAEIIRALAGSIGLMLSGAIATVLAVWLLVPRARVLSSKDISK